MTVAYGSIESQLVQWASARIANTATWQAICSAASSAAALVSSSIELDTDTPGPGPLAVTGAPSVTWNRSTLDGQFIGTATIAVVLEFPPINGDTLSEEHRRALNALTLVAEIIAENDTKLKGVTATHTVRRDDHTGTDRPGWFMTTITLTVGPLVL